MILGSVLGIRYRGNRLGEDDAARIAQQVQGFDGAKMVLLYLRETTEASTAALARLILLRSRLMKSGRDLRIVGLAGRADALYNLGRMEKLLPRERPHHRARAERPADGVRAAARVESALVASPRGTRIPSWGALTSAGKAHFAWS